MTHLKPALSAQLLCSLLAVKIKRPWHGRILKETALFLGKVAIQLLSAPREFPEVHVFVRAKAPCSFPVLKYNPKKKVPTCGETLICFTLVVQDSYLDALYLYLFKNVGRNLKT